MNFMLDINSIDKTQPIDNFSDKLLYGGQMLLIGMLIVFSVLVILWITLSLFKLFFHDLSSGKKRVKEVKEEAAPVYQAPVASQDDEIIAVIAAAIAMAESECGGNKKFRVVSFNRK